MLLLVLERVREGVLLLVLERVLDDLVREGVVLLVVVLRLSTFWLMFLFLVVDELRGVVLRGAVLVRVDVLGAVRVLVLLFGAVRSVRTSFRLFVRALLSPLEPLSFERL